MDITKFVLFTSIILATSAVTITPIYINNYNSLQSFQDAEIIRSPTKQIIRTSQAQISLLTVPDTFQFYDHTSGQCSLEAIFNYYQFHSSAEPYRQDFFINPADIDRFNFTSPQKLIQAALKRINNQSQADRRTAFDITLQQNMTTQQFQSYLKQEIPVILLVSTRQSGLSGSYIIGIGQDNQNYYFEDPYTFGNIGYIPKNEFGNLWQSFIESQNRKTYHLGIVIKFKDGRQRQIVQLIKPSP